MNSKVILSFFRFEMIRTFGFCIIYSAVLAFAVDKFFLNIAATEMISYGIASKKFFPSIYTALMFPGFSALLLFTATRVKLKQIIIANFPGILFLPLLAAEVGFLSVNLFIIIFGICLFRSLLLCKFSLYRLYNQHKWSTVMVITITSALVIYGILIQWIAYKKMFLTFSDWGLFYNVADNTLNGRFLYSNWEKCNFFGVHFMPVPFAVLLPLIAIFRHPMSIFILNSTVLWGSGILLYYFMVKHKVNGISSGCIALVYLLSPSVFNMNTSLYYGFHCIYLFIPLFFWFYILYQGEKYIPAFLIFILTLGIKETVPVFWMGWAIVEFICSRKKQALVYLIVSIAVFLFLIKVVIPFIRPEGYAYTSHYAHLGNGLIEIALSPFVKPQIFWKCLFSVNNLNYLVVLIVPMFIIGFSRPLYLLIGLPQLIFVMLRLNTSLVNNCSQYQTETFAMISINMAIGAIMLKKCHTPAWFKWLSAGLKLPSGNSVFRKWSVVSAISALGVALVCHHLYAVSLWNKYSNCHLLTRPDCQQLTKEIKQVIPAGSIIGSTERLATHLMCNYRPFKITVPSLDYYIMDLSDHLHKGNKLIEKFNNNPDYGLVWMKNYKGHLLYIFKHHAPDKFISSIQSFSTKQWDKCGSLIKVKDPDQNFEIKVKLSQQNNTIIMNFYARVIKRPLKNVKFIIGIQKNDQTLFWTVPYDLGITSATQAKQDDVYKFSFPVPNKWQLPFKLNAEIISM